MSLIEARGLSKSFGSEVVLHDVNLAIERGEIVTIVGPNGSGKSTLLRMFAGVLKPSNGELKQEAGLKIGYVPQKLELEASLPMTVRRFLDVPRRVSEAAADRALERVAIAPLKQRSLTGLSGGQMQRVLLARALIVEPDILMLDEPTQGLDQQGQADFYRLIEELRAEIGCAVLMVSHELHVVMSASDRVICLNGHICCEGTPEIVRNAPEYRRLFGTGTQGALALYRHEHDHVHDETCAHEHEENH
ncbi:metal ABC transporter ATP-binding protein [Lentibacter sp. XHP0401]|uniref:metal ABC transporter ATP-binding protein n=1 Tax=Lentibacter sp. XHP0401 TaxID=2984334 RepID=UPI0021E8C7AB|nr:metal ABC transporter ATP-binding protein [Lentibacter sp. XHP0401]MCV2894924.1 metal ABC transporter ATP-binding protein [Lentibacter sp. XHP0401]